MAEKQLKVDIDESLMRGTMAIFKKQGVSQKEGVARLMQFLLDQPPELHVLVLKQLNGDAAPVVAKALLEHIANKKKGKGRPGGVMEPGGVTPVPPGDQ